MSINIEKKGAKLRVPAFAWFLAAVTTTIIGTAAMAVYAEKKEAPSPTTISVRKGFNAIFRHLKADEVCYEPSRSTYLIHFREGAGDGWANHWYIIKHPSFHYIPANQTWFLEQIPNEDYTRIWPNVKGLQCATAPDDKDPEE